MDFEKNRETQLQKLAWTIQTSRNAKFEDVKANDKTIKEMTQLSEHVVDEAIVSKLEVVIAQKQAVGAIDRCQLDDLNDMTAEIQSILKQMMGSICLIEEALTTTVPAPVTSTDVDYSVLIELENVWKEASESITEIVARMDKLKDRYDMDRLSKLILLGEPIPPSLSVKAKKSEDNEGVLEIEDLATTESFMRNMDSGKNVSVNIKDISERNLDVKDEKELVKMLAKSVGKVAVASAKIGIFGFKAILETLSEEEVSSVTSKALEKSSGIGKVTTGLKESIKNMNNMESENDLKSVIDEDLKNGLKSTGETLRTFGEAGSLIVKKVGSTSSGSLATSAVKQSSDDLIKAFNVVTALSRKTLLKRKQEMRKSTQK